MPGVRPKPFLSASSKSTDLKKRADDLSRLCRRHDRHDLGFEKISPTQYPLLKKARVVAGHELKAAAEPRFDPASFVGQPLRHGPTLVSQAAIDFGDGARFEPLDHHE